MSRWPIVRFVLTVWTCLLAFQALFLVWITHSGAFAAYLEAIARSTATVLGMTGYEVVVSGSSVFVGNHQFQVVAGCDGLQAAAFVAIAIAVSPATLRARVLGAVLGIGAVVLLNLVRTLSLVVTLVEAPSVFESVHGSIWPAAIMVFAIACWTTWASQAIPASRWWVPL